MSNQKFEQDVSTKTVAENRIPHSNEELYGYFAQREAELASNENNGFEGYAALAANAADAIELARRYGQTDEVQTVDIALAPEVSGGILVSQQTEASKQLFELIIFANRLGIASSEMTEEIPYGRTLYQSTDGSGVNLLETRWIGEAGDMMSLTALSHLPEDLTKPEIKKYDKITLRAIRRALKVQEIATNQLVSLPSDKLEDVSDYAIFLGSLPVADFESPYDQVA